MTNSNTVNPVWHGRPDWYYNSCYAARNAYVNQDLPKFYDGQFTHIDKYGKFVNYVYGQNSSPDYRVTYADYSKFTSEEAERSISNLKEELQNKGNEFAAYISVVNINPDSNLA